MTSLPSARRDDAIIRAVAATFFINGLTWPSLIPRYPAIIAQAGVDEALFGVALGVASAGGLLGAALVPATIRRCGRGRVAVIGGALILTASIVVPWAAGFVGLASALAFLGLGDTIHDLAMNEVALRAQARRGRSLMGRMHAAWSVGSVTGTVIGTALAFAAVPATVQALGIGVVALAVHFWASTVLLHDRATPTAQTSPAEAAPNHSTADPGQRPSTSDGAELSLGSHLGVLGLVAVAVVAVLAMEVTPGDWVPLLLTRTHGTGEGVAGLAVVMMSAGILVGRSVADNAIDRWGGGRVTLVAGLLGAVSATAAWVASAQLDQPWLVIVAMLFSGIGAAPMFPLLFSGVDAVAETLGFGEAIGSTVAGAIPRLMMLVLAPSVGWLAATTGIPTALIVVAGGGVVAALTMPRLHAAS